MPVDEVEGEPSLWVVAAAAAANCDFARVTLVAAAVAAPLEDEVDEVEAPADVAAAKAMIGVTATAAGIA